MQLFIVFHLVKEISTLHAQAIKELYIFSPLTIRRLMREKLRRIKSKLLQEILHSDCFL